MGDNPEDIDAEVLPAAGRSARRIQHFDVDLGARVRAMRIAANMSQTALGEAVGISFQQVQKYERGKDRISASTLYMFATALNVSVCAFYEGASQPQSARPAKPTSSGLAASAKSGIGDRLSAKIIILFQQIDDPGIRKHLVALVTALADMQAGDIS